MGTLNANKTQFKITCMHDVEAVAAAHIHKAEKGKNGPPVVTLELASRDRCIDVDVELLKDIAKNEHKYYVNVHTEAHPQGAIRGQLDQS